MGEDRARRNHSAAFKAQVAVEALADGKAQSPRHRPTRAHTSRSSTCSTRGCRLRGVFANTRNICLVRYSAICRHGPSASIEA